MVTDTQTDRLKHMQLYIVRYGKGLEKYCRKRKNSSFEVKVFTLFSFQSILSGQVLKSDLYHPQVAS